MRAAAGPPASPVVLQLLSPCTMVYHSPAETLASYAEVSRDTPRPCGRFFPTPVRRRATYAIAVASNSIMHSGSAKRAIPSRVPALRQPPARSRSASASWLLRNASISVV